MYKYVGTVARDQAQILIAHAEIGLVWTDMDRWKEIEKLRCNGVRDSRLLGVVRGRNYKRDPGKNN